MTKPGSVSSSSGMIFQLIGSCAEMSQASSLGSLIRVSPLSSHDSKAFLIMAVGSVVLGWLMYAVP